MRRGARRRARARSAERDERRQAAAAGVERSTSPAATELAESTFSAMVALISAPGWTGLKGDVRRSWVPAAVAPTKTSLSVKVPGATAPRRMSATETAGIVPGGPR
jgi:hypothetical protein